MKRVLKVVKPVGMESDSKSGVRGVPASRFRARLMSGRKRSCDFIALLAGSIYEYFQMECVTDPISE
jgi:hypothetical protein